MFIGVKIIEYNLLKVNIILDFFLRGGDILIYDRIKQLCESKGLTVAALERNAGLSNGTVGKWNNSSPTMKSLKAVSKCLGVSVSYLLELDAKEPM